jgi:hypothetical protein
MNKEDERMWWSLSKAKQRELERLARRFDFTVMEVLELARAFATAELNAKLDPAPGVGEPFEFTRPDFIMNDYFEHAAVPAPDARVNYIEARDNYEDDMRIAAELLDGHPPIATCVAMIINNHRWLKFYARRAPKPEQRERYKAEAEDSDAIVARLVERAEQINARIERRRAERALKPEGSA